LTGLKKFSIRQAQADSPKPLKLIRMMIALFILSIAVFGYLIYVLIKPEKF
jgi:K+-transporting ATPase KdpF subunit